MSATSFEGSVGTPLACRTVLITGARSGIGQGLALGMAEAGASIVLAVREAGSEATATLAAQVRARGAEVSVVECDVTIGEEVRAAVDHAVNTHGSLDTVVHNANSSLTSVPVDLATATEDLWEEQAAVSLRGAFHCAKAAFGPLEASGGSLILMTSSAGYEGNDHIPLYAMVKGGQRAMVKALAREWGPYGVRVNAVMPLAMTPAMENAWKEDPALRENLSVMIPLARMGDPELDIAPAAVFLASDGARYVTGQTIVCTGGRFTSL